MTIDPDLACLVTVATAAQTYAEELLGRLGTADAKEAVRAAKLLANRVTALVASEIRREATAVREAHIAREKAASAEQQERGRKLRLEVVKATFGDCPDCTARGDVCHFHGGPR